MVTLNSDGFILNIENPQFGNSDSLEFTRIFRPTLGGDTVVFRDNAWPKIEKLKINFEILSRCNGLARVERLKNFLKRTLGKEFLYTDQDGKNWTALITNPNTPIAQSTLYSCKVALELEVVPA